MKKIVVLRLAQALRGHDLEEAARLIKLLPAEDREKITDKLERLSMEKLLKDCGF